MPDVSPPFRRWLLGERLRELREDRNLTGEEVASRLERHASWISRLESGRISIRAKELRELLDLYGILDDALRDELDQLAEQGRRHPWWSTYRHAIPDDYYRYIGYESEASRVEVFSQSVIPGQLQTQEYARAILTAAIPAQHIRLSEERLALRMRRQLLLAGDRAPSFLGLVTEEVLRREVGGRAVLHGQLNALLSAMGRPNIQFGVVPSWVPEPALMESNVSVIYFERTPSSFVHLEGTTGGSFADTDRANEYLALMARLKAASLNEAGTRATIIRIRDELEEGVLSDDAD